MFERKRHLTHVGFGGHFELKKTISVIPPTVNTNSHVTSNTNSNGNSVANSNSSTVIKNNDNSSNSNSNSNSVGVINNKVGSKNTNPSITATDSNVRDYKKVNNSTTVANKSCDYGNRTNLPIKIQSLEKDNNDDDVDQLPISLRNYDEAKARIQKTMITKDFFNYKGNSYGNDDEISSAVVDIYTPAFKSAVKFCAEDLMSYHYYNNSNPIDEEHLRTNTNSQSGRSRSPHDLSHPTSHYHNTAHHTLIHDYDVLSIGHNNEVEDELRMELLKLREKHVHVVVEDRKNNRSYAKKTAIRPVITAKSRDSRPNSIYRPKSAQVYSPRSARKPIEKKGLATSTLGAESVKSHLDSELAQSLDDRVIEDVQEKIFHSNDSSVLSATVDERLDTKENVTVTQSEELSPTTAPVGSPFNRMNRRMKAFAPKTPPRSFLSPKFSRKKFSFSSDCNDEEIMKDKAAQNSPYNKISNTIATSKEVQNSGEDNKLRSLLHSLSPNDVVETNLCKMTGEDKIETVKSKDIEIASISSATGESLVNNVESIGISRHVQWKYESIDDDRFVESATVTNLEKGSIDVFHPLDDTNSNSPKCSDLLSNKGNEDDDETFFGDSIILTTNREVVSREEIKQCSEDLLLANKQKKKSKLKYGSGTNCNADFKNQSFVKAMESIMRQLLQENFNRFTDHKRICMEEVHQLFNGFKGLDVDRDGFLSVKDVMKYFSKHKASILIDEVKLLFWSLDDNCRGDLTFEDVKEYYFRVKEQLNFWIKLSDLEKNAEFIKNYYKTNGINEDLQSDNKQFSRNNISCKTKAYMNTREKHAKTIVKKASANISEPMLLYRLLRFASLENQKREVHLLSALQQLVEKFGPTKADEEFEQIFCRNTLEIMDNENISLQQFYNNSKNWELKYLAIDTSLSVKEKAEIYQYSKNWKENKAD